MSEQELTDVFATPRRQHPVAAVTNLLRTLREMLIPIIIVVIVGGGRESSFLDPVTISLLLGILLLSGVMSWMRFTYRIENNELRIEYGIFVRKKLYIPKERIQVIDISSGVVQRMFGLVKVQVQTAGSSSKEAQLSAVTIAEARELKKRLLSEEEIAVQEQKSELSKEPDYKLSTRRLFIAASTSSSFGVAFSIIGYVLSQLDQFVDDEMLAGYIEEAMMESTLSIVIYVIIAAVLFAWILSLLGTLARYSRFAVKKRMDELVITRGFFERKNITVPFDRVQAVRIVEGIFRQPFGYAAMYVESAGYGDEGGESTVLMPLIKKSEIPEFLDTMLPEFKPLQNEINKPPIRAIPRFIFRLFIPIAILTAASEFIWELGDVMIYLFIPALFLALMRYKDTGVCTDGGRIMMQFRNLAKTTAMTKKPRVQSASSLSNWFQRRRNLKTFSATVASGKGGRTFSAENLDEESGDSLLKWVSPV